MDRPSWMPKIGTMPQATPPLEFSSGGDQIGPEYHGYILALMEGSQVGKLDYTYYNGELGIRMVEVEPAYRRMGIADALLTELKSSEGDIPVYSQGDFNTSEGQSWLDKNGIGQWNGGDPYTFARTAKHGFFYHTAPREYREQIEREGLVPTNAAPESPWADMKGWQRHEQPPGVYLWDDPSNARGYAFNLEGRASSGEYPGDRQESFYEDPHFEDHMANYPGKLDEYGDPEDSEEYYNWESQYKPRPLYDIWKVNTLGYDPQIDPEMAIHHGEMSAEEAQERMNDEATHNFRGDPFPYDPWQIEKTEGHRWYVPHTVEPQRLTLHQSVYPEEMTTDEAEELWGEGKQIPNAWHQVPLEEWNPKAQKRYVGDPYVMREVDPRDRTY